MITLRGITWDHPRGYGGLRASADAYSTLHTDVKVEWHVRSLQAFADQPADEVASRFDLIVLDHPSIGAAADRGVVLPLDEHLDRRILEEMAASAIGRSHESYVWADRSWALAIDAAAQVAAYRADLLARADALVPRSWDDVLTMIGALRRQGLRIAMPSIPVDAVCAFLGTCRALGEEPFTNPTAVVGRPVGREALEVLRSVIERSHPASLTWNPPSMLEHMATEDDVAFCPLAFGYSTFGREGFVPHPLRFAPGPVARTDVPSGTLGGAGLAVSAASAHPDAACAYAAFVAAAETQRTTYVSGGGQPAHRAAWTDAEIDASTGGFFGDTIDAVEMAYLRPRNDGFLAFQDRAGALVHAWLREGGDADRTLDALDATYMERVHAREGVSG